MLKLIYGGVNVSIVALTISKRYNELM